MGTADVREDLRLDQAGGSRSISRAGKALHGSQFAAIMAEEQMGFLLEREGFPTEAVTRTCWARG